MNMSNKHAAAFRLHKKFIILGSRLVVSKVCLLVRLQGHLTPYLGHEMNSRSRLAAADDSHRELKKTLVQLSFFNSRQLSVSFGPAFMSRLDISEWNLVSSWKNLPFRNVNDRRDDEGN